MINYSRWFAVLFLVTFFKVSGQPIIPLDFMNAVKAGTRTLDGTPGTAYFQNSSDYHINVDFNPKDGTLSGTADITYFNNSPDTLHKIVIRLYQNHLKKGNIRDYEVDPSAIHNGVNITSLRIDSEDLTGNLSKRTRTEGTLFTIYLVKPLKPANQCSIQVEWNVAMPCIPVRRYGKYGDGTYFIGYWYPQVSVYDDLHGWDLIPYTGTQEFYNDFNNYDVTVRVPSGYMVWATGTWENPGVILHYDVLQRYEKAKVSDEIIHIISPSDLTSKRIFASRGNKAFHFTADLVPDFAFAVSDNYVWDGASVITDSATKKRVFVSAAYKPGEDNFNQVVTFGKETVSHTSFLSYGIPYPYPCVTVFNGRGGMEYPMIVNNGTSPTKDGTLFVTMHEISHAYFPFLTGINETRHAWIDEGLTTYLPIETEKALGSESHRLEVITRNYEMLSGAEVDLSLQTPSWQTREGTYFFLSYGKSVVAFSMLEKYMGRESFRRAMQEFIQVWEYKHPAPCDLFNIMKKYGDSNTEWFIDSWFTGKGWPDLSIGEIALVGNNLKVEIKNTGTLPVPVVVTIDFKTEESAVIEVSPAVWKEKDTITVTATIFDEVVKVRLGSNTIPDKNNDDNSKTFTTEEL